MTPPRRPSARTVDAVERAVAVLDALARDGETGTSELARRIRVHPSSVSRLLATLEQGGLVTYVEATGRYRLGARLVEFGAAALASLDLRTLARPHLQSLVEATGETATLSLPGDPDAITVDFVQSPSSVQSVARLGRPSVAHATATGKVVLAFGAVALPAGRLRAYTARTITSRRELQAETARVRAQGIATALGEREEDLNAVAAPILGARGELVAVIAVQGPASRFDAGAIQSACARLREQAAALSHALGGPGTADDEQTRGATGWAMTR